MALRLITPPDGEPVTLADARRHLQLADADTEHDAWITARIPSIRRQAEAATRRAFMTQTWRKSLDAFPECEGAIELLPAPVSAVTSVTYVDTAGATITMVEDTDYQVDLESEPARVLPAYGKYWPTARWDTANAVQVTFTAGVADAADVSSVVKFWILERLATTFAFREQTTEDGKALPPPDFEVLDPDRVVTL
jgi:uncharacterized phiE125 gp8 family phage protein